MEKRKENGEGGDGSEWTKQNVPLTSSRLKVEESMEYDRPEVLA
jgi:hypothetical protein